MEEHLTNGPIIFVRGRSEDFELNFDDFLCACLLSALRGMRCKLENPIQTKSGYVPQNQHNRMTSTFCRVVGCGKQAKHSRRATSCCQQDYVLPHVLLHGYSLRGMVRIVQSVTVLLLWVFISGCFYFPVRSHEMTQIVS